MPYTSAGSLVTFLLQLAAHIGERQHRDCWPVERRRGSATEGVWLGLILHGPDETKAFAGNGSEQALRVAAVPLGRAAPRGFGWSVSIPNGTTAPDFVEELVLGDHRRGAPRYQVIDQVEDLRLDGNEIARPTQLAAIRVE